jgi:uncharacterized protein (DUF1501 family)
MKRRSFLRTAVPAGILMPALFNGYAFKAFAASPLVAALTAAPTETDHVLVIIQLTGGNDGLNMVVPLDQYGNLANARPNIILPKSKILALDGTSYTGLHPAMTGLQSLYNEGKVKIVQSVGYPNPDFSHFRATDIWLTGSGSDQVLETGWGGRYLSQEYANYPVGYPNTIMPDPLAIQIGSTVSPALQGPVVDMGLAITDPTNFYNLINGIQDTAPNTNAGKELTYIRQVSQQTQQYGAVIKAAAAKVTTQGTYPTNNTLANQLKIVARLIAGGLKTRIYMVSIGSFDTHSLQVNAGATETGRRIKSNASNGTDHGSAAPLFLFGDYVQSGVLGTSPTISSNVSVNDNIPMQYDYRSVYASVLQEWFCCASDILNNVMLANYQSLPVIRSSAPCVSTNPDVLNALAGKNIIYNYPNPFSNATTINFQSQGGHVLIQVFNIEGALVSTIVNGDRDAGEYEVAFEGRDHATGTYYARLQNGSLQQVHTMMLVK